MNDLLVSVLSGALKAEASMKTRKYFIGIPDKEGKLEPFDDNVRKVANTIMYLAALESSSFVMGGEIYKIEDYCAPDSICTLVTLGKISINMDALNSRLYMFNSKDYDVDKITTPQEFNQFFNDFNENQGDRKLECKPLVYSEGRLFSELASAKITDGSVVKLSGTVSGEAAALMGVSLPLEKSYCKCIADFTVEELKRWILS